VRNKDKRRVLNVTAGGTYTYRFHLNPQEECNGKLDRVTNRESL